MKRYLKITKDEFLAIFKDGGAMLILFGAMLLYGTLYPLVYAPQVVTKLPVAVVDLDNTPPSRHLGRMLGATPEADVRYNPQSLDEAKELFMDRKIHGILLIPEGYEKRILSSTQNHVSLYADGGYFLMYSNFLSSVAAVVGQAGAEIQMSTLLKNGVSQTQAEWISQPMAYKVEMLYNPYNGYATALLPAVLLLIAQQLILIGIGMVGGTWYERGRWSELQSQGYSAFWITISKAAAYFFLYVPLLLYMFSFQYKLFGYPIRGSHTDLLLVMLPYLLSCIFLGLTLGALVTRRESSIMLLVGTSVFFLMISGISWPREGMPEWIYALGQAIPSSSGIDALVRIRTMGATAGDVAQQIITLWTLVGVYGLTAVLATLRRMGSK